MSVAIPARHTQSGAAPQVREPKAVTGAVNDEAPRRLCMRDAFRRFAAWTATTMGSPWAFVGSAAIIVVWAVSGPIYHFSDTWQLVINTGTTIITFLMVFLIQNTQNRDGKAIQLKLDELIRAVKGARNRLVELEDCSDEELAKLKEEFAKIREKAGRRDKGARQSEEKLLLVETEQQVRQTDA